MIDLSKKRMISRLSMMGFVLKVRQLSVYLCIVIVLFFKTYSAIGQDIHFSQFFAAPLLTNPANTGMAGDNFRLANNYRNQWAQVGVPYQTFCTSLDKKVVILNHTFGVGGLVVHDQSSSLNLSANEFFVSLSYSRYYRNQLFTFGLQPGFAFKSYNLKDVTFGSQFDELSEIFSTSIPSMENGLEDRLHYFDLNMGVFWTTLLQKYIPSAGISLSHINFPLERFSTSSSGKRLPMRITFNGQVIVPFTHNIDLTPCVLYSYTPGATEFLFGSKGDYKLDNTPLQVKDLFAVTMFRVNPFRNIDAWILGGGIGFMNFDLGLTYDFNISPLRKATNFNGAFEISLMYTGGKHSRKSSYQPCYIIY
jgi:type IX secretion system PorP/SprF family membrane protein